MRERLRNAGLSGHGQPTGVAVMERATVALVVLVMQRHRSTGMWFLLFMTATLNHQSLPFGWRTGKVSAAGIAA